MSVSRHFVLAAGGTGGHMMPAFALAEELIARGHRVALITDRRGETIPGGPDPLQVHVLPAGRITRSPSSWLSAGREIWRGRAMALSLFRTFGPTAVVGFGGYPALPALLAASAAELPGIVHEQNAVLGRVNRLVARRVALIATAFPEVRRLPASCRDKVRLVGNPVRPDVRALRSKRYPPFDEDGIFRVMVTGGSQGASILSEVVPEGLGMLPVNLRRRLQVTQQCRADEIEDVRRRYAELEIPAELATFLPDLPKRLGWAHLVIARAGASTLAELSCAGRPAILIPFPAATDDHQSANARELVAAGGARAIPQRAFTPKELAKQIQKLALSPDGLARAAAAARSVGRPDAAERLADLVEGFGQAPVGPVEATQAGRPKAAMAAAPAFGRRAAA